MQGGKATPGSLSAPEDGGEGTGAELRVLHHLRFFDLPRFFCYRGSPLFSPSLRHHLLRHVDGHRLQRLGEGVEQSFGAQPFVGVVVPGR